MSEREPVEVTNLDIYGSAELPWSRARDQLVHGAPQAGLAFFLGTIGPDGRPHSAGIGPAYSGGDLHIVSGPGTRKSRDLAPNPAATVSVRLQDLDLILEGEATRITDQATLHKLAGIYREGGWPAEVKDDAFTAPIQRSERRPSALVRVQVHVAHSGRGGHSGTARGDTLAVQHVAAAAVSSGRGTAARPGSADRVLQERTARPGT